MRTKLFSAIAAMAIAFGFAACSDEDLNSGNGTQVPAQTNYLKVNINQMNVASGFGAAKRAFTRASDETHGDGTYHSGEGREGYVGNVRFYFFSNGQPFNLSNSQPVGVNFIDHDFATNGQTNPDTTKTIETRTSSILVLSSSDANVSLPDSVVAIVNPEALGGNSLINSNQSLSLEQLLAAADTTNSFMTTGNNSTFLMTNSAYVKPWSANATQAPIIAQSISGHLQLSSALADEHPVDIYVERLAAKVTVTQGNNSKWETATVNNTNYSAMPVDTITVTTTDRNGVRTTRDYALRAVVRGWGIADGNAIGNVFKNINDYSSWWRQLDNTTGNNTNPIWNSTDYNRSFWEITPTAYRRVSPTFSQMLNTNLGDSAYTMPNTPSKAFENTDTLNRRSAAHVDEGSTVQRSKDLTKIVVAAQLQKRPIGESGENWTAVDSLYRFNGRYYLDEASIKRELLRLYPNTYYKTAAHAAADTITADDIAFAEPTAEGKSSDYQLSVILKNGTSYYDKNGTEVGTSSTLNRLFGDHGAYVTFYNHGDTYYYTTIQHLWNQSTANRGYFGVVRNHWYRIAINSLAGPGTPVPNPDKPIIPVTPQESMSYLNARINVLQWRVVNQSVDIDGNTQTRR